jgi:hypothetical protein
VSVGRLDRDGDRLMLGLSDDSTVAARTVVIAQVLPIGNQTSPASGISKALGSPIGHPRSKRACVQARKSPLSAAAIRRARRSCFLLRT